MSSIVAGCFLLVVPTIQLTGRTLRVRDPSYLFPNMATQPASEALLTIGMRHLSVIGTYIMAYFARRTVFCSVVGFL
jgi:hypothetical protein